MLTKVSNYFFWLLLLFCKVCTSMGFKRLAVIFRRVHFDFNINSK